MTWRWRLRRSLNQRIGRGPIPKAAREFLAGKRLTVSDHYTDVFREEHAVGFTAARMTQERLVEEVHRELVKALEAGETFETFRTRIQPWLERRGWAPPRRGGDIPTRLERIYRTNMKTARAAGRWHRIEQSAERLPFLVYRLGPSLEHRDQHVAWAGTILPVDHRVWDRLYPPNGWGCQYWVYQISRRKAGRLLSGEPGQYRSEAPELPEREWVNPATGEVRRVTAGVDPGWDYNPGRHRTLGIHRRDAERSEAILAGRALAKVSGLEREQLVRRRIQRSLAAPGFRWFIARPRAKRPPPRLDARDEYIEAVGVGVAPTGLREAAEVSAGLLYLPLNIADKQWRQHGPDGRRGPKGRVPVGWYADIQNILDTVKPARQEDGRWRYDDVARGRRLVVDRDGAGRLIVISYHPRKL